MQALAYQIFQFVTLIFIGFITLKYYRKYPEDEYLFGKPKRKVKKLGQASSKLSEDSMTNQITIVDTSRQLTEPMILQQGTDQGAVSVPDPGLWSTFKIIYPYFFNSTRPLEDETILFYFFNMFLVFVITMNLVPAISFAMGTGWDSLQSDQLIYLIFNIADLIGKMIFSYYIIESPFWNNFISLSRFGLVHIHMCVGLLWMLELKLMQLRGPPQVKELQNDMLVNLSFTFMVGFTGGYLNSSVFHVASSETKNEHQSNSAFLMIFAILAGLSYGAFVNTFGLNVSE